VALKRVPLDLKRLGREMREATTDFDVVNHWVGDAGSGCHCISDARSRGKPARCLCLW
jgi:hypothetical protein